MGKGLFIAAEIIQADEACDILVVHHLYKRNKV